MREFQPTIAVSRVFRNTIHVLDGDATNRGFPCLQVQLRAISTVCRRDLEEAMLVQGLEEG